MLVEGGVEVHEVGEEPSGGYFAGQLKKVVVGVLGQIAHAAFLLPYLDREYGCGSVAHAFVCGVEQLANNAAAFG